MLASIRPYATAGVALVGAGVIAAAPVVAPPIPESHVTVPQVSSQAVELSAFFDPLTTWIEVFTAAFENGGVIAEEVLSNPAPVLRQILANQIGYLQTIGTAGQGLVEGLTEFLSPDNPGGLIAGLQEAVAELTAGNFAGFVAVAARTTLLGPVIAIGLPLLASGLLEIPAEIVQNVANVVTTLTSPLGPVTMALLSGAGTGLGVANAFGDSIQLAINAIGEADPLGALTALLNAPGVMAGALLNGYSSLEGFDYPGLLVGADGIPGLVEVLTVTLPRAIADALGASGGVPTNPFGGLFSAAEKSAPSAAGGVGDPSTGSGEFVAVGFDDGDGDASGGDAVGDNTGQGSDAETVEVAGFVDKPAKKASNAALTDATSENGGVEVVETDAGSDELDLSVDVGADDETPSIGGTNADGPTAGGSGGATKNRGLTKASLGDATGGSSGNDSGSATGSSRTTAGSGNTGGSDSGDE